MNKYQRQTCLIVTLVAHLLRMLTEAHTSLATMKYGLVVQPDDLHEKFYRFYLGWHQITATFDA